MNHTQDNSLPALSNQRVIDYKTASQELGKMARLGLSELRQAEHAETRGDLRLAKDYLDGAEEAFGWLADMVAEFRTEIDHLERHPDERLSDLRLRRGNPLNPLNPFEPTAPSAPPGAIRSADPPPYVALPRAPMETFNHPPPPVKPVEKPAPPPQSASQPTLLESAPATDYKPRRGPGTHIYRRPANRHGPADGRGQMRLAKMGRTGRGL